jgi:glycogen debranching enzyme
VNEIGYGRRELSDWDVATALEWRVSNGAGGSASGTVGGALAHRDHGLLIVPRGGDGPPVLRLAKLIERVVIDGVERPLDTNAWASGARVPAGHRHLETFHLEGSVPVWWWGIGDTRLEKRVWMEPGEPTTYVQYHLGSGHGPVRLVLGALANGREARVLGAARVSARTEPYVDAVRATWDDDPDALWLSVPGAEITERSEWHRDFGLARDTEGPEAARDEHQLIAEFSIELTPGHEATLVASTRAPATGEAGALARVAAPLRRRAHDRALVEAWRRAHPTVARHAPPWVRSLVIEAESLLPSVAAGDAPARAALVPGGWRDALVALPGLALATGRSDTARALLERASRAFDCGLLPDPGVTRPRAAAEAPLWFVLAVRAYHEHARDDAFLGAMLPVLEDTLGWFERGTRYGISVNPGDGLLRSGDGETPMTWWESVAGAPRIGKAIDVNALWYNALTAMASFTRRLRGNSSAWEARARRVRASFARFWDESRAQTLDLIDGPRGPETETRAHQLLAVSLPDSPLAPAQAQAVVHACGRHLLTPYGLAADVASARGGSWTWLLPHFALAATRVHRNRAVGLSWLEPLAHFVADRRVGALSERAAWEPPHRALGTPSDPCAVAEALRAYHALAGERPDLRRRASTRGAITRTESGEREDHPVALEG